MTPDTPALCQPPAALRFGRLTLTGTISRKNGRSLRDCICDCGAPTSIRLHDLKIGKIRSCGCLKKELSAIIPTTHGATGGGFDSPEYRAWRNIKCRTRNPNTPSFQDYGARGIFISDDFFHSFEAFLSSVGKRPSSKHSIDRINNDKGYEHGNLRWPTRQEQNRNRRDNKLTARDAEEIRNLRGQCTQRVLAERYRVHPATIYKIQAGKIWQAILQEYPDA